MPPLQRNGTAGDGDNLILTPSKLRLHSHVFGPHITCMWLANAMFAALILLKVAHAAPVAWWAVFLPQWIGHAAHVLLLLCVLLTANGLIRQQLGPAPPATASPGMMMQYGTMFEERRISLILDSICTLLETLAAAAVKAIICSKATAGTLASPGLSWRLIFMPCWLAWSLTLFILLWKPKRERAIGTMRDLLYICLMFVALKLDGLAPYSWNIVFLIPWMWFATLLIGAIVTAGVIIVAYACMDLRELSLPGGFLLLLLSAASQLPGFVYLSRYLDGDVTVGYQALGSSSTTLLLNFIVGVLAAQQILLPQVVSWTAMWVSGLIICYGLYKKEQLRASLAAAGQVWTRHESAARELMSLELEDMQQHVDKMSNDELAQVAVRMMAGKVQPQQLLRVGSTLYKAISFSGQASLAPAAVMKQIDDDGTAPLGRVADASDAMEAGLAWPAQAPHQHSSAAMGPDEAAAEGAVCVSVQVVLRTQQPAGPGSLPDTDGKPSSGSSVNSDTSTPKAVESSMEGPSNAEIAAVAGMTTTSVESARCEGYCEAGSAAPNSLSNGNIAEAGDPEDDGLCTICYDRQATCVFMSCGHGGYCWRCAHVLYARPPHECPACRRQIEQVVELEDPHCRVGEPARVKAPAAAGGAAAAAVEGGEAAPQPPSRFSLTSARWFRSENS